MNKTVLATLILVQMLTANFSFSQNGWVNVVSGTTNRLTCVRFVNSQTGFCCGYSSTILKSADGGISWNIQQVPVSTAYNSIFFVDGMTGFAAGGPYIIKTTNSGSNWEVNYVFNGITLNTVCFVNLLTGYAAGAMYSPPNIIILRTTDAGLTWNNVGTYYGTSEVSSMSFFGSDRGIVLGYLSGMNYSVARRTFDGISWSSTANIYWTVLKGVCFVNANEVVTVGSYGQIYRSTNAGFNWVIVDSSSNLGLNGVCFSDSQIGYSCGSSGRVLKTTNAGVNWFSEVTNTYSQLCSIFFIDNNNGVTVGYNGKILKTTDGGGYPTAVGNLYSSIPDKFMLQQNYPNPFNPVCVIKYDLPKDVKAVIKIYDILGREVKTLVNEFKKAGAYTINFDGSMYASGVYFYRIEAGDFIECKKMVLIK